MKRLFAEKQKVIGILSISVLLMILLFSILSRPSTISSLRGTAILITSTSSFLTQTEIALNPRTTPLTTPTPIPTPTPLPAGEISDDEFRKILINTMEQINKQEKIDQEILIELHSGEYTFENPLVIVNPYEISPLTALVAFSTSSPAEISIGVKGQDSLTDFNFAFEGFNEDHIIPVYGLYPNKENQVTLESKNTMGEVKEKILKIQTDPLSEELKNVIFLTDLPMKDRYQPGLNFTYEYGKSAFDAYGQYRWYLNKHYLLATGFYKDHFIFAQGAYHSGNVIFIETNPLGRIYRVLSSPYGVHHDIEVYKDNLLVTGSEGNTVEDLIYELDPQTGEIRNKLDLKTIFQRSRLQIQDRDWFHNNALSWDTEDDSIIISSNHQSAISKISWPEGKLEWILAPDFGWLPMFEKYILKPKGIGFEYSFRQHAPEILPDQDQNPDTLDILLFDNGNERFINNDELQRKIRNNEVINPDLYSRMVQYRIDEKNKTVRQIWQFGKELGKVIYSPARGSANLLANGNRLGFFDVISDDNVHYPTYFEVTDQSQIVWSAQATSKDANGSLPEYRVTRMDIYNQSANDLGIGTPVINLIPQEILDKYGVSR
jgi:arylsulfate sulfotransferase